MKLQALLVLSDESAVEVLRHVLADFQMDSEPCPDADSAIRLFDQKRVDALFLDFDESQAATHLLNSLRQSAVSRNAVAVGLLNDPTGVRAAFGIGANFVLYKPISGERAHASLRAAIALLKRERRRTFRVPVQLPLKLSWQDTPEVEGIMLDLSEDGMDVLSAQPLQRSQRLEFQFSLPDSTLIRAQGQVAWANTNGQAGVEFTDFADHQRDTLGAWVNANAPEPPPEEPEPLSQCKLSDLSLGGCYVETESPFPPQARVNLVLKAGSHAVGIEGVVRVMHPSRGMGVEFAWRSADEQVELEQFINFLSSQSEVMPSLLVAPKSISFAGAPDVAANYGSTDALLNLLRSENALSQEEFLEELRRQRGSQAEPQMA